MGVYAIAQLLSWLFFVQICRAETFEVLKNFTFSLICATILFDFNACLPLLKMAKLCYIMFCLHLQTAVTLIVVSQKTSEHIQNIYSCMTNKSWQIFIEELSFFFHEEVVC